MDGVLIDSTKHIWESFNRLVEPLGIHFDEVTSKKYLGNSLRDQIVMWKRDYGIDVGDANEFSAKATAIQNELMRADKEPNAELLKLLRELKEKGIPMGVGTSSVRVRAETMLSTAGIDHYFNALVTAEDVSEHKPNPHTFLEVARRIDIPPEKCVVIEDASSGIEAARNGNMKSIGFLTEWNSREELCDADKLITNFRELSYEGLKEMFDSR